VSHNVSRGKQDEIERSRRLGELRPFVVAGWQIDPSKFQIVEIKTVLGYHQRGQEMLLRCQRTDCRRRIEIDFRAAVHAGLGDRPVFHLHHLLRCHHWSGCRLEEISATYPKGVPLVGYLQHPDVLIAILCTHCEARLLLPPKQVIARLKAAGRGDGSTGILELARVIRGPCRKCGVRRFECQVIWSQRPVSTAVEGSGRGQAGPAEAGPAEDG
jgi:hypothetical protein